MMLTEFQLGGIHRAFLSFEGNVSAVSRETGIDRRTIKKYVQAKFQRVPAQRKRSNKVIQRRKLLVRLAGMRLRKGSRVWPKFCSAAQLQGALLEQSGEHLSVRQIQRQLNEAGLTAYVRTPVPTRASHDVAQRKAFAAVLRQWPRHKLRRIVFSDESWLTCCEQTGRMMWAKSRAEVLPLERKCRWNVPSMMIWACVGYNFKSPLVILPSKRSVDGEVRAYRLDSDQYVRRCLSLVAPQLIAKGRIFQQDGARSHACRKTLSYLKRKGIEMIDKWPAYSPDLNAIERIWKELQCRIGKKCPMSLEELVTIAREEWDKLPQQLINAHCDHFETQLHQLGRQLQ